MHDIHFIPLVGARSSGGNKHIRLCLLLSLILSISSMLIRSSLLDDPTRIPSRPEYESFSIMPFSASVDSSYRRVDLSSSSFTAATTRTTRYFPRVFLWDSSDDGKGHARRQLLRRHDLPEQTDRTQVYDGLDSEDLPDMERRVFPQHDLGDAACEAAPWQKNFYPNCNEFHATDLEQALLNHEQLSILSSRGSWRLAWQYYQDDAQHKERHSPEHTIVIKTLQ